MKNVLKTCLFLVIFMVILHLITYLIIPVRNVTKNGIIKSAHYEILGEEENSVDVLFLGDSLVYSSISPMEIWNEYGYTSFDCSESAQITKNTYKQLEVALENQKPKIVFMESNVLFRNPANQDLFDKVKVNFRKLFPFFRYHNNWKKYMSSGSKYKWINPDKGFWYINEVQPSKRKKDYMKLSEDFSKIPEVNMEYLEKIIDLCKKNNIEFVLMSLPAQKTWNYKRHNTITKLASEKNIEFLDINLADIGIDWKSDTRDKGSHVNSFGAKKVSSYLGKYLSEKNIVTDHRGDKKYASWDEAYKIYESVYK